MSKRKKQRAARRVSRSRQIETLEARIVMSADPLLGPLMGHHAINDAPSLSHHDVADFGPSLGHGIVESAPVHDPGADFWLNSDLVLDDDNLGEEIEQTLYDAHGLTGQDDVVSKYGFDGAGQTVVVIDSGIAYNHYALGGGLGSGYRVVGGWDFTENDADPYDDGPEGAHGTHVAGIIGAQGDGQHSGVATGVDLVGLRVFDDAGNGYFSWVEQALDWVHTNKDSFANSITAVNLSLGTDWNSASIPSWAMLEDEFAALEADGIFISVSAGNSFTSYNYQGLSYPAASSHVIPVMSVDNDGSLSYFSQRATNAIAAPGRWITSTVPDYAANDGDTIDDDWLSMSGTSMAAPYMAGASALVRQAMEFVGQTGIDQWDIYDHMMATADSFYDSATSATYQRLNLEAAIDALMPTDDYGSTIETAYDLGTINDDGVAPLSLMTGAITTLTDADYFTFTAGASGTVTFETTSASHGLVSEWDGWGGEWTVGIDGYSIDVIAGQSYSVALSSSDGLGYYDLEYSLESSFSFVDLGAVASQEARTGLAVSGEQWYSFTAGQSGYFTVESLPQTGTAQVDLYDANQNLLANDIGSGRADAIVSTGDTVYVRVTGDSADLDLRLTNAVSISGAAVSVTGTTGDDAIEFHADATNHTASLNGVWYTFDSATETTFTINGGSGTDSIVVYGSSADETALVGVNSTQLSSSSYVVTASSFGNIVLVGGGGIDSAHMYGSTGDDTYRTYGDRVVMSGESYYNRATDFDLTYGYANSEGDTAWMYGSTGDDTYRTYGDRVIMSSDSYYNRATGFDNTYGYADSAGDSAWMYGSTGDDTYRTYGDRVIMSSDSYYNRATGFSRTNGYGDSAGDTAWMYGSVGDDDYKVSSTHAIMSGTGFINTAASFSETYGYADSAGDEAWLFGSLGDDTYRTYDDRVVMSGADYYSRATGFAATYGYANSAGDTAWMYGSTGDDTYRTYGDRVIMSGAGFYNRATGFEATYGYADTDGDIALMYDTAGSDLFRSYEDRSIMSGDGYYNRATGFTKTYGYSTGGGDSAWLHDSAGDDHAEVKTWGANLNLDSGVLSEAHGFNTLLLYGNNGGTNTTEEEALDYIFGLIGGWE